MLERRADIDVACLRPRANSKAVAPFMTIATAATHIIVCGSAGDD